MRNFLISVTSVLDVILIPFVLVSGVILKLYRRAGSQRLPKNTAMLKKLGVFPIKDHYYEPLFNDCHLDRPLSEKRNLPGIDFRESEQLEFLKVLTFQEEFEIFLRSQIDLEEEYAFRISNGSFESGDAEFLYNFVRHVKPSSVIEIGCGSSTKIISHALKINEEETGSGGVHTCIEPFEQPWLSKFENVKLTRKKLEDVDATIFSNLSKNDILFIDSSHIIRPQGDVLREYLEIIPSLSSGVYIHVHDIFTPRDYLEDWIKRSVLFWNEQYMLEALLSNNPSYRIVAALNYLKNQHYDALKIVCPHLVEEREPGSFYFVTV